MAAPRNPRWTRLEIAILRESYPLGGIKAVSEHLPYRSIYSIRVKLSKLGIKCVVPQQHAPRCALAGNDLEEAINLREERHWSFEKIGAKFGVSESAACNAVMNALCIHKGHTPAERDEFGRLTARGIERLRWMLKKGLKGIEIQLRLGVSGSCVAEQRRRYNSELKTNGKAPLPLPGGGERYCGVKLTKQQKADVERHFFEGFGRTKVSSLTGVSLTACTRIRSRIIRRLRRDGRCLPGCDIDGNRHQQRGHARHVPDELRAKVRSLILDRVPVKHAAAVAGVGTSTAYRIRDELKVELGDAMPTPRLPGRVSKLRADMLYAQVIQPEHLWRYRVLVREHGDVDKARVALRAEIADARRSRSFEEQLEAVRRGDVRVVQAFHARKSSPDLTLGGVATGQLA